MDSTLKTLLSQVIKVQQSEVAMGAVFLVTSQAMQWHLNFQTRIAVGAISWGLAKPCSEI